MNNEQSVSLAENVYRQLRSAIVDGEYRPNERLIEADIARRLDASRTPVRESLQRLHNEGLVDLRHRSWTVREHDAEEIMQIYDIRTPLEGYAARLAAQRASDDQIAAIVALNAQLTFELAMSDRSTFIQLHDEFHRAVYAAAANPRLSKIIHEHRHHRFNRRIVHLFTPDQLRVNIAGHAAIVEALRDHDGERIELITREHLEAAKVVALQLAAY